MSDDLTSGFGGSPFMGAFTNAAQQLRDSLPAQPSPSVPAFSSGVTPTPAPSAPVPFDHAFSAGVDPIANPAAAPQTHMSAPDAPVAAPTAPQTYMSAPDTTSGNSNPFLNPVGQGVAPTSKNGSAIFT